jgi:hypothetical protein
MVGEVEGPKIDGRQEKSRAAGPGDRIVQPAALESGAVDRLVQRREQEDEHDAVGQHGRQQPGRALREGDHAAGREQREEVQAELPEPAPIGARCEPEQRPPVGGGRRGRRVDRILPCAHDEEFSTFRLDGSPGSVSKPCRDRTVAGRRSRINRSHRPCTGPYACSGASSSP